MTRRLAIVAALVVAVAACAAPPGRAQLSVAVAASLAPALAEAGRAYEAVDARVRVTLASGSSAALRTQIEQGAPFDVLLSADTANAQALADAGLATGAPVPFATNTLALVVPPDNPAGIASARDLARPGVRLVGAAGSVPIAAYTARLIEALAAGTADPAAFTAALDANVVSREQDVAAVLARVELGEADAAFVYATDAARSTKVITVPVPEAASVRTTCAAVIVKGGPQVDAATGFVAWLAGEGGRSALRPFGFLAP